MCFHFGGFIGDFSVVCKLKVWFIICPARFRVLGKTAVPAYCALQFVWLNGNCATYHDHQFLRRASMVPHRWLQCLCLFVACLFVLSVCVSIFQCVSGVVLCCSLCWLPLFPFSHFSILFHSVCTFVDSVTICWLPVCLHIICSYFVLSTMSCLLRWLPMSIPFFYFNCPSTSVERIHQCQMLLPKLISTAVVLFSELMHCREVPSPVFIHWNLVTLPTLKTTSTTSNVTFAQRILTKVIWFFAL